MSIFKDKELEAKFTALEAEKVELEAKLESFDSVSAELESVKAEKEELSKETEALKVELSDTKEKLDESEAKQADFDEKVDKGVIAALASRGQDEPAGEEPEALSELEAFKAKYDAMPAGAEKLALRRANMQFFK